MAENEVSITQLRNKIRNSYRQALLRQHEGRRPNIAVEFTAMELLVLSGACDTITSQNQQQSQQQFEQSSSYND